MKQNRSYRILGITGGAGSGKSTIVEKIKELVPTVFLHCDVIAHELMEPGGASYEVLLQEYGADILEEAQDTRSSTNVENTNNHQVYLRPISRPKLAAIAMATESSRKRLNELTHPLVRRAIEEELDRLTKEQYRGVVVIEAALLIEAGYKEICDSLWYVYAPLKDRVRRMKEKRGYSEEKIANILAGQLSEEAFRAQADVVIDNPDHQEGKHSEQLLKQIKEYLKEYLESMDKM